MATMQSPPDLIGQSKTFLDALEHASRVAMIDRPALITGERGSGKALFAARIHFLSPRWEGPFVKVSCAAFNDSLDAELFGTEGSSRRRTRLEQADGGTLFLEDIASAPLAVQEKILRLIEHGDYERAGSEQPRNADIRIIASTSADLRLVAHEGLFRADLLDRLAFSVVAVPPLRERPEDIPLLSAHFGALAAAELALKHPGFSVEAALALKSHSWPGNVRELRTVVERAVFYWGEGTAEGVISEIVTDPLERAFGRFDASKIMKPSRQGKPIAISRPEAKNGVQDLRAYMNELEKAIVEDALANNGGSQKRAADALSLTYDQIRGVIKKHGLSA